MSTVERVDVVVVGGGLSGLAAARALREGGASVVVVEGRDRVGGRTLSQIVGRGTFDLGGQWLGPTQHRMRSLARELGVELFATHHDGVKVLETAAGVSTHKHTIPSLPLWSLWELHRGMKKIERDCAAIPAGNPRGAPQAGLWDSATLETWLRKYSRSQTIRDLVTAAMRVVFGAEPSELSVLHFLYYLRSGGGLMSIVEVKDGAQQDRLIGGAQQISERMAAMLGDAVVLSAPVRRIAQSAREVNVITPGHTWRARRAIVAIAPALAGQIDYEPALPALRTQLTQRFPMGQTIKCLALYDEPFWRRDGFSGEAVATHGPLSVVYDNTTHDGRQASLVGFMVAGPARYWGRRPADERRAAVLDALARYFGPRARQPSEYIEKNWGDDPFSGGCPTGYLVPGAIGQCWDALREPVGRIHWAGTETAIEWGGFMEGAVEAGRRAASEVLAIL